jgi:hypothetical protein
MTILNSPYGTGSGMSAAPQYGTGIGADASQTYNPRESLTSAQPQKGGLQTEARPLRDAGVDLSS